MEDVFMRNCSCAITGHRALGKSFNRDKTEEYLTKLIDKGFTVFYIGMALGFDTVCFQILEKLRKENNKVKIIACIPCLSQADRFNYIQKAEYDRMISSADEKVVLSKEYTESCMQNRNEYMVDRAGVVLAYMTRAKGGTFNTVNYAIKKGIPVINIGKY